MSGQYSRGTIIVTAIATASAAVYLAVVILRREDLARRIGRLIGGWYNQLLAGRWKFQPIDHPGQQVVEFRGRLVGTLGSVWSKAAAGQIGAEITSFILLLLSLRFLGVTSSEAGLGPVFVAYAVGLIASLVPLLPQGLGAVELAYVLIIAGTEEGDLADTVMAAAFTHRIFIWFLPILVGVVPLIMWRRRLASDDGESRLLAGD